MKRTSHTLASGLVAFALSGVAQAATSTFDDLTLTPESHYFPGSAVGGQFDGASTDFYFTSGNATFKQTYSDYGADCCASGWTYSNHTDMATPGYTNQYSAYTGSGQGGSANYGLAYAFSPVVATFSAPSIVSGAYFTNTTYAALSMLQGDSFAKKFGGSAGNDPDYFKLTITGYEGAVAKGSVDFYLADFRSADSSKDYIVNSWTFVNLSSLGAVTQLGFALDSSDVGAYGMNTPAYFAMDTLTVSAVPEPDQALMLMVGLTGLVWRLRRSRRTTRAHGFFFPVLHAV